MNIPRWRAAMKTVCRLYAELWPARIRLYREERLTRLSAARRMLSLFVDCPLE
jgi:hypothetical protein